LIIKKFVVFPLLFLLALIYSCSDSPTSIGVNLLGPDYINVKLFDSYQDSTGQTSSYFKTPIKLSDSPWLLVGKYQNVEASALVRFGIALPDSIKNAFLNSGLNIIDAKIEFTREYKIGNTANPLNYSVHFITSGWTSFGFTADSIPSLVYDNADIASNKISTDSLYTFKVDNQTINSWFLTAADSSVHNNKGIYIKSDPASTQIIGFDAFNVDLTGIPKLTIVVQIEGITDTLGFYSIEDVSAISGDAPVMPAGDIAVQGGLAANGRVMFDLTSLPPGAVVNKAELTLFLDSTQTNTGDVYSNYLTAYFAKDSTNAYDSTSGIRLSRTADYFSADISRFIQSISSGYHENNGFIITAGGQNLGVDIYALKGSDASDTSVRPRLVITYTGLK
jgi:hypothetical protein